MYRQIALIAATVCLAAMPARAADYEIAWTAANFPVAAVTAHLQSPDCTFSMSDHWADFFDDKRGWTRFVSNFRAFDGTHELPVQMQDGTWHVGDGTACKVKLEYNVDFSFGRKQWPPGNEQVAWTDDHAIYTTGLPLFVLGEDGKKPLTISMSVPEGWMTATPWNRTADGFSARNRDALLNNTLVIGLTYAGEFHAQNLTVTAALLGNYASSSALLTGAFTKIVPDYVAMFGDNQPGRYMFAVIPGPEDGEAYQDSFAVATTEVPAESNRIVWANHLSHELLHYWMGNKLAPSAADSDSLQWFTEGFTEYLANRALLDTHIYNPQEFADRMGRHMGAYLLTRSNPNFVEITPMQSGAHKWKNRPLVYSGGATIAFCLDARIREASNGKHTIRDMMHSLFARRARDKTLTYLAIKEEASYAAGINLDDFFKRYVDGTDTLPLKECAATMGYAAHPQNADVFLELR